MNPLLRPRKRAFAAALVVVVLALAQAAMLACAQPSAPATPTYLAPSTSIPMTHQAKGSFDVKLVPQPLANAAADKSLGRLSVDKVFSGDMQGTGQGEMLYAGSPAGGSAGYVAIEQVNASIGGRQGTFVLQHAATMNRGAPSLSVGIVPDSGTGAFVGISGSLVIDIVDGKHFYLLTYTLPEKPPGTP